MWPAMQAVNPFHFERLLAAIAMSLIFMGPLMGQTRAWLLHIGNVLNSLFDPARPPSEGQHA